MSAAGGPRWRSSCGACWRPGSGGCEPGSPPARSSRRRWERSWTRSGLPLPCSHRRLARRPARLEEPARLPLPWYRESRSDSRRFPQLWPWSSRCPAAPIPYLTQLTLQSKAGWALSVPRACARVCCLQEEVRP